MKKIQTRKVVIGKKKVWSVSYADDVVLMANKEEGMREMIRKFGRYIERRGLEINTDTSMIMRTRKGFGRKRKIIFK